MTQSKDSQPRYRMAQPCERQELKRIWQDIFHDDAAFTDWFFDNRFLPEYCPVAIVDGRIASCLHALPAFMRVRQSLLPCALIGGVSTLPEYRGKGLMRGLFAFFMPILKQRGFALVSYRPENLAVYAGMGHYPVCDAQFVTLEPQMETCCEPPQTAALPDDLPELYELYNMFSRRYSGIIARSYADFAFKFDEYAKSSAIVLTIGGAEGLRGYAVCFDGESELAGDECVAMSSADYDSLLLCASAYAPTKRVVFRLPPDISTYLGNSTSRTVARAVAGVVNAAELVKALGAGEGSIKITDPLFPENTGVFSFDGKPGSETPLLSLSTGELAQWALGYKQLSELRPQNPAAQLVDRPKLPCYIVDEY